LAAQLLAPYGGSCPFAAARGALGLQPLLAGLVVLVQPFLQRHDPPDRLAEPGERSERVGQAGEGLAFDLRQFAADIFPQPLGGLDIDVANLLQHRDPPQPALFARSFPVRALRGWKVGVGWVRVHAAFFVQTENMVKRNRAQA